MNTLRIGVLVASCLLGACALPQRYETFRYDRGSIVAYRYAGQEGRRIDEVRISLRQARPFLLKLPNGRWINSRAITRDVLLAGGMRTEGDGSVVTWQQERSLAASLAGRHKYLMFTLDADGIPDTLHVSACIYGFDELFATADAERTYGFPLTVGQSEELFGKPASVESIPVVTGFSCI